MRREDWSLASEPLGRASGGLSGSTRRAMCVALRRLVEAGRLDEAEALAYEAVERFPDRPGGYVQRGEVAMRRGDWSLAVERWGELRSAVPDHAAGYVRGAEALVEVGRLDEAEGLGEEAVKRFPKRPGGRVPRAEDSDAQRGLVVGERALGRASFGLARPHGEVLCAAAEALVEVGSLDEAEAVRQRSGVARSPTGTGDTSSGARWRCAAGIGRRRARFVCELRSDFPDHTAGYVRGAEALVEVGRLDEAEGLACEAVERFPDRPGGYIQREPRWRCAAGIGRRRVALWERASFGPFPTTRRGMCVARRRWWRLGRLDEAEAVGV